MLKNNIELRDFQKNYLPFKFKGFWNDGYCYLKVLIKERKALFLCCQLPNYTGTSVTNAVESIVEHAAMKLDEEQTENGLPVVKYNEKLGLIEFIKLGFVKSPVEKHHRLMHYLFHNSVWIEHYPPEPGLGHDGLYAHVVFTDNGEPIWNYAPLDVLAQEFNVPDFFNVDYEELNSWNTLNK